MIAAAETTLLEIKRIFDAPPDRVFDAWMDREEWQSWIGPEGVNCDVPLFEPRVGGRYRIVMHIPDGRTVYTAGVFKTIVRPKSFSLTWGAEGESRQETVVTVTLKDLGGKTELTLRHEGLPSPDSRDGHAKGWNSALNKLTLYLADPRDLRTQ